VVWDALVSCKLNAQERVYIDKYGCLRHLQAEPQLKCDITQTFNIRPEYISTDSNKYTIIEYITNNMGKDMLCGIYQDLLPNQIVYLVLLIVKSCFLYLVTQPLLLVLLIAMVAYNRYRYKD
jgi:hypothetical protein